MHFASVTTLVVAFILPSLTSQFSFVTSPDTFPDTWYFGHDWVIEWSSVATDPDKLSVSIVNNDPSTYPTGLSLPIKSGLRKSWSKYVLPASVIQGLKEGTGYRINLMTEEWGGILAQSPMFTVSSEELSDTGAMESDHQDNNINVIPPKHHRYSKSRTTSTKSREHNLKKPTHENSGDTMYHHKDQSTASDKEGKDVGKGVVEEEKRFAEAQRKMNQRKKASDKLLESIPKFDRTRTACTPNSPRVDGPRVVR